MSRTLPLAGSFGSFCASGVCGVRSSSVAGFGVAAFRESSEAVDKVCAAAIPEEAFCDPPASARNPAAAVGVLTGLISREAPCALLGRSGFCPPLAVCALGFGEN